MLLFLPDELPPEFEEPPDALLLVSVVSADEVLVVVVVLELSDFAEVVPVVFCFEESFEVSVDETFSVETAS